MKKLIGLATAATAAFASVALFAAVSGAEETGPAAPVGVFAQISALNKDGSRASERDVNRILTSTVPVEQGFLSPVPPRYQFEAESAKVLVDDQQFGKVIVVPAERGNGICFDIAPSKDPMSGMTGCDGSFNDAGLFPALGQLPAGPAMTGLVEDGITGITIVASDGRTADAAIAHNVFKWASTDESFVPVKVRTTSASGERSAELRFPPRTHES